MVEGGDVPHHVKREEELYGDKCLREMSGSPNINPRTLTFVWSRVSRIVPCTQQSTLNTYYRPFCRHVSQCRPSTKQPDNLMKNKRTKIQTQAAASVSKAILTKTTVT